MNKSKNILFIIVLTVAISVILLGALLTYSGVQSKIVVIPVKGEISLYGSGASSQTIVQKINDLNSDIGVKAIILEINSPGGTVVASREISEAIKESKKPIVAWQREVAASGAYWISASCDYIIADPATITGGIGVSASYLQFARLMENYGVAYESIISGKYKDVGSPYKDLTPNERALLQSKVDMISSIFLNYIKESRNLTQTEVDKLATGEFILGSEAKNLGLIDELGSKDEAFKAAKKLANVKEAHLVEPEPKLELFLKDFLASQFYWMGHGIGDSFKSMEGKYVLEA